MGQQSRSLRDRELEIWSGPSDVSGDQHLQVPGRGQDLRDTLAASTVE